jgi:hypothetical protein
MPCDYVEPGTYLSKKLTFKKSSREIADRPPTPFLGPLFENKMSSISFVLGTVIFQQIRVCEKSHSLRHRESVLVRLGIVDCDLDIHMTEIPSVKTLCDVHRIAIRVAGHIKPPLILETDGIHDQHATFPSSGGIAKRGRLRIVRELSAIPYGSA